MAEEEARRAAEEQARREEEERDRQAIQERLRKRREKQRRVILPAVLAVLLPPFPCAAFLQIYSFEGKRAEFERAASTLFGFPVKVGGAKFWFFPGPQWRMNREGLLGGGATLLANAAGPRELLPSASLSGNFVFERGMLAGVDLDKVLQERGRGDETRFASRR